MCDNKSIKKYNFNLKKHCRKIQNIRTVPINVHTEILYAIIGSSRWFYAVILALIEPVVMETISKEMLK